MQVDHHYPIVPLNRSLEDMTPTELVDRIWCDEKNLTPMCKPCHNVKTKAENKERRRLQKEKKANG